MGIKGLWSFSISTIEKGIKEGKEEGIKDGIEKGIKEGKEEGRVEEKRESARKLKKLGMTTDVISQVTGLLKEDIDNLM